MISNFFGYILNWLYNVVGQNYGVAIILFTLLIRIVLLPITIKQQKSMKKSTELQSKIKEIQFKYKNNQDQMQKEDQARVYRHRNRADEAELRKQT